MVAKYRYTVTFSDGQVIVFVSAGRVEAAARGLLLRRSGEGFRAVACLPRVQSVSCEPLGVGAYSAA